MNLSKTNVYRPAQLPLGSSDPDPTPEGSLGLCPVRQGGVGGLAQPSRAPPQAQPHLPDSEGGVTQGALTARGTPGDLSGQFPYTCHSGI